MTGGDGERRGETVAAAIGCSVLFSGSGISQLHSGPQHTLGVSYPYSHICIYIEEGMGKVIEVGSLRFGIYSKVETVEGILRSEFA